MPSIVYDWFSGSLFSRNLHCPSVLFMTDKKGYYHNIHALPLFQ